MANLDESGTTSAQLTQVLNYITAASAALATVAEQPTLTVQLLNNAHALLVKGTASETADRGRIRTCQVAIGSPSGRIEDSRFVPMPPGADLGSAVRHLVDWMNDRAATRDPIVAAALAHYQFETLHPYNDGNGRIGRLLIVLQFMRDGVLSQPLLSVSPWFEQHRNEYQDRLAGVSATGHWDDWVQFFARGIAASAEDTASRVDRLLSIQRQYAQVLQEADRRGVIRDVCDFMIGNPIVTVPALARHTGKSQPAINTAVTRLVQLRIVSQPIGKYNRHFVAPDVLEAITAPLGGVADANHPIRAALSEGSQERA